jgi:hypothetical protein
MKRQTFIILAVALLWLAATSTVNAQIFRQSGKTITDLCSQENVVSVEGDFNKDGVKDLFLNIGNYVCAFYFGKSDGGYTLFRDYDFYIPGDAKLSVTDKGVLRIQIGNDNSNIFLFRYQDNAFVLIGGRHDDESYNFLTDKKVETIGTGTSKRTETSDLPKHHPLKFGWFPLYWEAIWYGFTFIDEFGGLSPDNILSLGIYRRMQLEERIDNRVMCNLDSYYGKFFPSLDEKGEGSVTGTVENPYSYNSDCTVSFKKLPDGTFKIVEKYVTENRGYEGELEKYLSEHPEDEELDFDGQLKKAGIKIPEPETFEFIFIFDDGKFIEQN